MKSSPSFFGLAWGGVFAQGDGWSEDRLVKSRDRTLVSDALDVR